MHGYCRRKRSYLSVTHAGTVAAHLLEKHGRVLRPYRCPAGYGWHLTHQPKRPHA